MIILRLEGGLGNQLFQYAFARAIQQKYGGKILFDLHTFKNDSQRNLSIHHFVLNKQVNTSKPSLLNELICFLVRAYSRILRRLAILTVKDDVKRLKLLASFGIFIQEGSSYLKYLYPSSFPVKFLSGNWMSEKFFMPIREELQEELVVKTDQSENNKKIISLLTQTNSVCVHIRRGDYTSSTWSNKLLVCDFEYYSNALNFLNKSLTSPIFYIFSNSHEDINWIKDNYKFSVPVSYIDMNNPDYEELRLMMHCKHFVLSNSSFSWWASYLSTHKNKMVVAPSKWNSGIWDVSDIYLPDWHIIEV